MESRWPSVIITFLIVKVPYLDITYLEKSLYQYLEEKLNLQLAYNDTTISVVMPSKEIQKALEMSEKRDVVLSTHISYLTDNTPFEYTETYTTQINIHSVTNVIVRRNKKSGTSSFPIFYAINEKRAIQKGSPSSSSTPNFSKYNDRIQSFTGSFQDCDGAGIFLIKLSASSPIV